MSTSKKSSSLRILTAIFFLFIAQVTLADELVLSNGDTLHGTVVSIEAGTCVFESEVLGQLQIPLANISTFSTDSNMPVLLQDNQEPVDVQIRPAQQGVYINDGSTEFLAPLDSVLALGEPATVSPLEEIEQDPWLWSGNAELGFRARRGNSERASLETRAAVAVENSIWKISGHFRSFYSEQEVDGRDETTDDELKGGTRIARNIGDRISAYVALDLERDKIEDLRLRRTCDGGFCWNVVDNDVIDWSLCGGVGQENERYYNGQEESLCIAKAASDFSWQIFKNFQLTQQTEWIPSFESADNYRIVAETAGVIYLDEEEHFYFKMGLRHEYDNQPDGDDVERLDSYFFSSIGAAF